MLVVLVLVQGPVLERLLVRSMAGLLLVVSNLQAVAVELVQLGRVLAALVLPMLVVLRPVVVSLAARLTLPSMARCLPSSSPTHSSMISTNNSGCRAWKTLRKTS